MSSARIQSQLDTPKTWILNDRMFRIKSWEIKEDEIKQLLDSIVKHDYKINLIRGKEGELKGITLLYLNHKEDVETIRTNLLVTSSGTELRKTSQIPNCSILSRTIKTTAPLWISYDRMYKIFSKYNTDNDTYDLPIDHKITKGVKYP